MTPRVSVIIPSYNRKPVLLRAVRSALDQSIPPFEIIVVDDGSSDGTNETDFLGIDPRIRLIAHPTNRGGAVARNTGIDAAKGNWVALMDSDDVWLNSKLERQLGALREDMADDKALASCNVLKSFDHRAPLPFNDWPPGKQHLSEYFMIDGGTLQTSTLLLPTVLAKQVRFDERLARHQDWDFVLRLVQAGAKLRYIHDTLVIYDANDHSHKISAQKSIQPTLDWLKLAGPLITPKARHNYYLSVCFRRHIRERPLHAVSILIAVTLAHPPSISKTAAYFWGFLRVRLDRAVTALTFH
jgi:glycosyltransferase involved in cell wall biosynthesis